MHLLRFRPVMAATLLLLLALVSPSTTPSSSTSPSLLLVSAGRLEDLLAEGTDLLSGQGARDTADQAQREIRKTNKNPEACRPFACPTADHTPTARPGYVATSNGCGSYGFKVYSRWHDQCCDAHDKCYGTCGRKRDTCDRHFQACMASQCSAFDRRREREDCEGQASMFFSATRTLGCQAFLDSQEEACICQPAVDQPASSNTAAAKKKSGVSADEKKTKKTKTKTKTNKEEL